MNLIVPVFDLIIIDSVLALLSPIFITPFNKLPSVIPVAAKNKSSPLARSSYVNFLFISALLNPIS